MRTLRQKMMSTSATRARWSGSTRLICPKETSDRTWSQIWYRALAGVGVLGPLALAEGGTAPPKTSWPAGVQPPEVVAEATGPVPSAPAPPGTARVGRLGVVTGTK